MALSAGLWRSIAARCAFSTSTADNSRARTRRDVGARLCSAYAKMRAALVGGAGGDRAAAEALDELPEAIDALMSA